MVPQGVHLTISKLYSILAVANLLAHILVYVLMVKWIRYG